MSRPSVNRSVWSWGSRPESTPGKGITHLDPLRGECTFLSQNLFSSPNAPKTLERRNVAQSLALTFGGGAAAGDDARSAAHLSRFNSCKSSFLRSLPSISQGDLVSPFPVLSVFWSYVSITQNIFYCLPAHQQHFSKCVLRIPIRILPGAVKSAERLNRIFWQWGAGTRISQTFSGAHSTWKRGCTGAHASSEQAIYCNALMTPNALTTMTCRRHKRLMSSMRRCIS